MWSLPLLLFQPSSVSSRFLRFFVVLRPGRSSSPSFLEAPPPSSFVFFLHLFSSWTAGRHRCFASHHADKAAAAFNHYFLAHHHHADPTSSVCSSSAPLLFRAG